MLQEPTVEGTNPESQFMLEEDASDTGVGAVLSQRSAEKLKMYAVAYLSNLVPLNITMMLVFQYLNVF